jgi:anti-anti-sigma factor
VIYLEGAFRAPLSGDLRHRVHALLREGARTVIVDLASVPRIDAAGVGQLVRAYNVATAGNGKLKIVRATTRVREMLERVGLFELLSARGATRSH